LADEMLCLMAFMKFSRRPNIQFDIVAGFSKVQLFWRHESKIKV